jgi:transcriptional regulator with XRE-family HTH domain
MEKWAAPPKRPVSYFQFGSLVGYYEAYNEFRKRTMSKRKRGASPPPKPNLARGVDLSIYRQKAGISLEQVAAKTKISMRFLRAIEAEDFSQLPGGIFNTNYLRQYAETIGMDEQELLERYGKKMNPVSVEMEKQEPTRETRSFLNRLFRVPA